MKKGPTAAQRCQQQHERELAATRSGLASALESLSRAEAAAKAANATVARCLRSAAAASDIEKREALFPFGVAGARRSSAPAVLALLKKK